MTAKKRAILRLFVSCLFGFGLTGMCFGSVDVPAGYQRLYQFRHSNS